MEGTFRGRGTVGGISVLDTVRTCTEALMRAPHLLCVRDARNLSLNSAICPNGPIRKDRSALPIEPVGKALGRRGLVEHPIVGEECPSCRSVRLGRRVVRDMADGGKADDLVLCAANQDGRLLVVPDPNINDRLLG